MKESAVILAAGRGQRLGTRAKAALELGGRSFLECVVGRLRERGVEEMVVVVARPHLQQSAQLAASLGVATIENPRPERGMSSSIALGFVHAVQSFTAQLCWLWPVDTPRVEAQTLRRLARDADPELSIRPRFGQRGGHPVLVGRSFWQDLARGGDLPAGARSVFDSRLEDLRSVSVDDDGVLRDVDTAEDLAALSEVPK